MRHHHLKRDYFEGYVDICDSVWIHVKSHTEDQIALKVWQRVMNKVTAGLTNRVSRSETLISRAIRAQIEEDIEGDTS